MPKPNLQLEAAPAPAAIEASRFERIRKDAAERRKKADTDDKAPSQEQPAVLSINYIREPNDSLAVNRSLMQGALA